ncbi:hypothetical protein POTOM_039624 [Populus tomentosa]|uniref:COP9 signalosome complex subunit 3 n=1 Tax=Populus tomentosa TaxID=118781 RepID=A0A8X8CJ48_POPTO|nr:hypothetical protein POTOM_039624 [Populus tomentosa]
MIACLQFSTSLPKYTSSAAQRSLKTLCQDNNLGLVKQVISSMYKRNIQRLTQTYWTLSVQDIAKNVQLSSPKEAEMHVLQMIEDGEIYATINQKDGMVRFLEDPEQYKNCEMIEHIDSSIQRTGTLSGLLYTLHVSQIHTNLPTLTDKDKEVISSRGVQNNIDILSLSYTRHAEDVRHVFLFQKTVVFKCNMAGKPAVVTLVVDSMTENLRPPRAEATDVANAILDASYTSESVILLLIAVPHSSSLVRSNAILLGAETLRGLYPVETFSTVGRICAEGMICIGQKHFQKALELLHNAFSLLNESPRIQFTDFSIMLRLWLLPLPLIQMSGMQFGKTKPFRNCSSHRMQNKEYVADNESVGDTDSQDAAVSSKKLTELSDDENETGNSQTGLMDVINNVKLTVVDMVTNVSAYFKKIFRFSSAEHTLDAADENAGSSTTEKTLGASLMALAVMVIMVVVLRRP